MKHNREGMFDAPKTAFDETSWAAYALDGLLVGNGEDSF